MDLYQSLVTVNPVTLIAQICNLFIQLLIVKIFFLDKIKAVLDKFFSFYMRGKRSDIMKGKKCALLSCLEETDMEIGNESVRTPYLRATELLGWNSIGEVIVPGVYEAGAIKSTDGEERAARLAELI